MEKTCKECILEKLNQFGPLSIPELVEHISQSDYSTVFRNVEALHKTGELTQILVNNKKVLYELSANAHPHFVCGRCGVMECLTQIEIEAEDLKGYQVDTVTLRGVCKKCV